MITRFREPVKVPYGYPTATLFLDESGAKAAGSSFFVVAGIKLRQPGSLSRALTDVRDRNDFAGEFKFSEVTRGTLVPYYDAIDALAESDAHVAGCVVRKDHSDPCAGGLAPWQGHAEVAAQLLVGCTNRCELVSVVMDGISTPRGCSLEDTVRERVNKRLKATSVVSAICLDSRANDLLQVADLVAGAIAFERRRAYGESGNPNSNKAKVAARLIAAFGASGLHDGRRDRVNIATYRGRGAKPGLRAVEAVPQMG